MRVKIGNFAEHGIILDRAPSTLPQNAISSGRNIDFNDGDAHKSRGTSELLAGTVIVPELAFPYVDPDTGTLFWIYCGVDSSAANIATWDGTDVVVRGPLLGGGPIGAVVFAATPANIFYGSHGLVTGDTVNLTLSGGGCDIPNGTYVVTVTSPNEFNVGVGTTGGTISFQKMGGISQAPGIKWTGGVLNGLPVVNSGADAPLKWDRTADVLNPRFEVLSNWPAGDVATIIRPFRNFLVAMDVTKSGALRNPYMVRWSDAAEPFTEPPAWDAAPGNLAGEATLSEAGGYIIDAVTLRGNLIIYRQTETYIMRYTQGVDVMSIDKLFSEFGCLTSDCVKPFGDGMHFVVAIGDVFVHNGNTAKSIVDGRVKHALFDDLDSDNYQNAYVAPHYKEKEMWFCYPSPGNSIPNKIAKWNWETDTWTFAVLDGLGYINFGVIPTTGVDTSWNADTGLWDSDTSAWNEGNANPSKVEVMICWRDAAADTSFNAKFLQGDTGNKFNGDVMDSRIERTGLTGVSGPGGSVMDPTVDKQIVAVWPNILGGPVDVSVGVTDTPDGVYTWDGPHSFDPQTDRKVDVRLSGKYYGWKIESLADVSWEVRELVFEMEAEGER